VSQQEKQWDVFISHASEDKDSFVRPLAVALSSLGVTVWYDEYSLRLGDSLSKSIDKGLAESAFGLVVVSPDFIAKPWPEYELRGLVAREISEDRVILPIWHCITRAQVLAFSPPLADKMALVTLGLTAEDIAIKLLREIRPDLYSQHPRTELLQLASGEALNDLQSELESTLEELSEYRCPYCTAPLSVRIDAPADPEERDWDVREIFDCGFQQFGGFIERPCPADPCFPRWEEYELTFHHTPDEPHWKWQCYARGSTDMARRLSLSAGLGRTKDEAERNLREDYERVSTR
jgi:hypothetical protein